MRWRRKKIQLKWIQQHYNQRCNHLISLIFKWFLHNEFYIKLCIHSYSLCDDFAPPPCGISNFHAYFYYTWQLVYWHYGHQRFNILLVHLVYWSWRILTLWTIFILSIYQIENFILDLGTQWLLSWILLVIFPIIEISSRQKWIGYWVYYAYPLITVLMDTLSFVFF